MPTPVAEPDPVFATPSPQTPEQATVVTEDSSVLTNNHFDAIFTGGVTAASVAEFLNRNVPGLNVLLPNNAGEIIMPDMQLKDVNMREFMAAITAASNVDMANGNPGYSLTSVPGAPNIVIFQRLQPAPTPYGQGPVAGGMGGGSGGGAPGAPGMGRMAFGGGGGTGGGPSSPGTPGIGGGGGVFSSPAPYVSPGKKETQFFDLSSILQSKELKVDDITTAIRTAWSSVESGKMPPEGALKFHQETRLLIVTATPDYMQSANAIVNLLLRRTEPSDNERDQALNAVQQKMMMVEEARMRAEESRMHAERERETVEEKNREVRDKLQARITDLELELAKLRQQQEQQQQPAVQTR
ncbi:MAG: hypothetical protein EOP86_09205 [Verrucomicrobiaceae bacterium]|nr:MAG: hypothetical protein EOP86_09205 [Verrucomicrobiaceae bacterium]